MNKRSIRYRIVNKTRLTLTLALIIFMGISCVFGTVLGKEETEKTVEHTYIEYTVTPGDTLWDIAQRYNYNKTDVRELIYNIQTVNGMDDGTVKQGQTILIPVDISDLG